MKGEGNSMILDIIETDVEEQFWCMHSAVKLQIR